MLLVCAGFLFDGFDLRDSLRLLLFFKLEERLSTLTALVDLLNSPPFSRSKQHSSFPILILLH